MRKNSYPDKLTDAEVKRLWKYIDTNGGQKKAGDKLGVSVGTLSRSVNKRTAPTPLLRNALVGVGVIKA